MWDITSACPFLNRNLTLNLERSVQPLLTSQGAHTVSRIVSRAASLCPASAYVSIRAHTVSRSVCCAAFRATLWPTLRPPACQCALCLSLAVRQPVPRTKICTILDAEPHTAFLRFPVDTVFLSTHVFHCCCSQTIQLVLLWSLLMLLAPQNLKHIIKQNVKIN